MTLYQIVRFYREGRTKRRVMAQYLTWEEAQAHCKDPKTHGDNFFDGFERM